MEQPLRVHVAAEVLPGPVYITAAGHLTAHSCRSLLDALTPPLTLDGCPSITLDLAAITHTEHGVLQHVERHMTLHLNGRQSPTISIVGMSSDGASQDGASQMRPSEKAAAHRRTVGHVMSPLGPTVLASQVLGHAAHEITVWGEAAVVTDTSNQALGLITQDDLQAFATAGDDDWRNIPCGQFVDTQQDPLRITDSVVDALTHSQREFGRPMLVLNGVEAAGILYPHTVSEWSAEHSVPAP